MDPRDNIDEIEHAAEYMRAVSILSSSGWASVGFGVINVAIGIFKRSKPTVPTQTRCAEPAHFAACSASPN
jgi:hypothetical protein